MSMYYNFSFFVLYRMQKTLTLSHCKKLQVTLIPVLPKKRDIELQYIIILVCQEVETSTTIIKNILKL